MITVTDEAARQLRILVGERGEAPGTGLRLFVEKGGCAGLQYGMKLDVPGAGDEVAENGGARVMVDEGSLAFLQGCSLDFVETLTDTGFRIVNPNAVRSCGCGTSFETEGSPAPEGASC